eukprot:7255497-Alexandrium_andersonii.AAC.1
MVRLASKEPPEFQCLFCSGIAPLPIAHSKFERFKPELRFRCLGLLRTSRIDHFSHSDMNFEVVFSPLLFQEMTT